MPGAIAQAIAFFFAMRRYLILPVLLCVAGTLPLLASGDPAGDIRISYLNLDRRSGNIQLAAHYPDQSAVSIRLTALRDFLDCLMDQTAIATDRFHSRADYWIPFLKKQEPADPVGTAACIEISLYQAVLASQLSDYKTASLSLIRAYREIEKNGQILSVPDRDKLSGILGILFSVVPEQAARILRMTGVKPAVLGSFAGLRKYYEESVPGTADRLEGWLLMVTSLKEFSEDTEQAWEFVQQQGNPFPGNPLVLYQSALAALKAGHNDEAIRLLEATPDGFPKPLFPAWNYQLGRCYLNRLDLRAEACLNSFLEDPGGETYRHIATLRLAWSRLVHGQPDEFRQLAQAILTLPQPRTPYDKHAVREVKGTDVPDAELIRLRLLFDGGYYDRCLNGCLLRRQDPFLSGRDAAELDYRTARCYHRLGRREEAISHYLRVISQRDQVQSYWLPNSALQAGFLYKEKGQQDLARTYFELALKLNRYGYREGIERQAKAALAGLVP